MNNPFNGDVEESEKSEEFKSINFQEVSYIENSRKRLRTSVEMSDCPLCNMSLSANTAAFYKILSENFGHISFDNVIILMKGYYDEKILGGGHSSEEITTKELKNHLLFCIHEPLIEYYKQITQYKDLRDMMYNSAIQNNLEGEKIFDHKILLNIDKINKRILELYKERPVESLFTSDKINLH